MSTATTSQPTAPPAATTLPPSNSSLQIIPLSHIVPSKTNPRKTFDGPEFDELVASIKQHGVIQPVLVRPTTGFGKTSVDSAPGFELVAGERRFRASTAAGKTSIPAMVQILTDDQALEVKDAKKIPDFLAAKPVIKVTTQHHLGRDRAKGPDKLLTRKDWKTAHKGECVHIQPAIVFDTEGLHDQAMSAKLICANPKCDVHFGVKPDVAKKGLTGTRSAEDKAANEEKKKNKAAAERENKVRAGMLKHLVASITELTPAMLKQIGKLFEETLYGDIDHLDQVLGSSVKKALAVSSSQALLTSTFAKAVALAFVCDSSQISSWEVECGVDACDLKRFNDDLKSIGVDPGALRSRAERDLDAAKTPTPEQLASIADPKKPVKSAAKKSVKGLSSPKAAVSPKTKPTNRAAKKSSSGKAAKKSAKSKGGR